MKNKIEKGKVRREERRKKKSKRQCLLLIAFNPRNKKIQTPGFRFVEHTQRGSSARILDTQKKGTKKESISTLTRQQMSTSQKQTKRN